MFTSSTSKSFVESLLAASDTYEDLEPTFILLVIPNVRAALFLNLISASSGVLADSMPHRQCQCVVL